MLVVIAFRFVADAAVCPLAEPQVSMSGFILPMRKEIKCIADMALKPAAFQTGGNNVQMASSYFFKNEIARVIRIFFFSFF